MPRSLTERFEDILVYSERCHQYTAGKTYLAYSNDDRLRLATERCLEIVGEALAQAIKLEPLVLLSISDAVNIVSLRNRLAHDYYEISDPIIWSVVREYLPTLQQEARAFLAGRAKTLEESGDL